MIAELQNRGIAELKTPGFDTEDAEDAEEFISSVLWVRYSVSSASAASRPRAFAHVE